MLFHNNDLGQVVSTPFYNQNIKWRSNQRTFLIGAGVAKVPAFIKTQQSILMYVHLYQKKKIVNKYLTPVNNVHA